jgi:hypothetical protein
MQALFAATYADEIAAVLREGGVALRDDERRALRTAIAA